MPPRHNILRSKDLTSVLILHDRDTDEALTVLVAKSGDAAYESMTLVYNGVSIVSSGYIDTIALTETKPSIGSGLIKRSLGISIVADGPFYTKKWTRKLYSAGLNADAFYFSLWVLTAREMANDVLKRGVCIGKFVIDSALEWAESDTTLNFNLIDISQTFDKKLNYFPQEAVDKLQGSEWESLLNMNMYAGTFSKVDVISPATASTSVIGLSDQAATLNAGVVTYYTATEIGLGNTSFLAANVGISVKMLFATGELIVGVITADGSNYKLVITTRDVAWDTVNLDAYVANGPVDAALKINNVRLSSIANILTTGMFAKVSTVHFFNTTTPGDLVVTNKIVKLGSIIDATNRVLIHDDIVDPVSTARTLVGISYSGTTTNSAFPSDTQFNYAVNSGSVSSTLYFRDTTVAATNPQVSDTWTIYKAGTQNGGITVPASDGYHFVRTVGSVFSKLYAKVNTTYQEINSSYYTVTANATFQGIDNLIRVVLTQPWTKIIPNNTAGAKFDLYMDLVNTAHSDKLISVICNGLTPEYSKFFGYSFKTFANASPGMLCNAVITPDDTLSSVMDSLLYETGCTLHWRAYSPDGNYSLEIEDHINSNISAAYWPDPADASYAFCRPLAAQKITNDEIIDGSLRISVGKLDTTYDKTRGVEWVSAWLKLAVAVEIGASNSYVLKSNRTRARKDRYIDYTFRHAVDSVAGEKTAYDMVRAPHALCALQTTRTVNILLTSRRIDLEAGDVVELLNVPFISDAVDAPIFRDPSGYIYYRYNNANKYILLPHLFQIESININFTLGSYGIALNLKQVQFEWYPNVSGSSRFNFGVPDVTVLPPPITPGDPTTPNNPSYPPPITQCPGDGSTPVAPPATPNTNISDGCTPASCDTPEDPGAAPTTPTYGTPCPQDPPFTGYPNLDIKFDKTVYLIDKPGGVDIKLLLDGYNNTGSDTSFTLGTDSTFPYFRAILNLTSLLPDCALLSGPSLAGGGLSNVNVVIGEGYVGQCKYNDTNFTIPVNIDATVAYKYMILGVEFTDNKFAVANVFLKPLMTFDGSMGT